MLRLLHSRLMPVFRQVLVPTTGEKNAYLSSTGDTPIGPQYIKSNFSFKSNSRVCHINIAIVRYRLQWADGEKPVGAHILFDS